MAAILTFFKSKQTRETSLSFEVLEEMLLFCQKNGIDLVFECSETGKRIFNLSEETPPEEDLIDPSLDEVIEFYGLPLPRKDDSEGGNRLLTFLSSYPDDIVCGVLNKMFADMVSSGPQEPEAFYSNFKYSSSDQEASSISSSSSSKKKKKKKKKKKISESVVELENVVEKSSNESVEIIPSAAVELSGNSSVVPTASSDDEPTLTGLYLLVKNHVLDFKDFKASIEKRLDRHEALLVEHGVKLDRHEKLLVEHGEKLDRHEALLVEHGVKLDRHEALLVEHGVKLDRHEALLVEHGEKLEQHHRTLDQHGKDLRNLKVGMGRCYQYITDRFEIDCMNCLSGFLKKKAHQGVYICNAVQGRVLRLISPCRMTEAMIQLRNRLPVGNQDDDTAFNYGSDSSTLSDQFTSIEIDVLIKYVDVGCKTGIIRRRFSPPNSSTVSPLSPVSTSSTQGGSGSGKWIFTNVLVNESCFSNALCRSRNDFDIANHAGSQKLIFKMLQLERQIVALMEYYCCEEEETEGNGLAIVGYASLLSPSFFKVSHWELKALAAHILEEHGQAMPHLKSLFEIDRFFLSSPTPP